MKGKFRMNLLTVGFLMGLGGTAAMDIWAEALWRFSGQRKPNWAMPGRWVGHVAKGVLFHDDIGKAPPVAGERAIGWMFHYAVGIIYGMAYAALAGSNTVNDASFLPIWVFSILTIGAGWFLLQPGMGLGWAASKTPNPWQTRGLGLIAHSWFAVGMWGIARII